MKTPRTAEPGLRKSMLIGMIQYVPRSPVEGKGKEDGTARVDMGPRLSFVWRGV